MNQKRSEAVVLKNCSVTCSSLDKPSRPTVCIFVLILCLRQISSPPYRWHEYPRSRRAIYPAFYACFRWLTFARTSEDLQALTLLGCTCSQPLAGDAAAEHKLIHAEWKGNEDTIGCPFFYAIHSMLWLFGEYGLPDYDYRMRKIGCTPQWPRSPKAILPHGPEHTLRALINLFVLDLTPSVKQRVYTVLHFLLGFVHPLLGPHLANSSTFVLKGVYASVKSDAGIMKEQTSEVLTARRQDEVLDEVLALLDLMSVITVLGLDEAQRVMFHHQGPQELLQAYEELTSILHALRRTLGDRKSTNWQSAFLNIEWLGGKIYDDIPNAESLSVSTHCRTRFWALAYRSHPDSDEAINRRLVAALDILEKRDRCAAPGCPRTSADGPLKRCAGCQRVAYCSRACQKAAWRHAVAHRDACAALADMTTAYGLPVKCNSLRWSDQNPGVFHVHNPTGEVVLRHLIKLSEFEMTTPCEFDFPWHLASVTKNIL
jgi:hypothetical protein